MIRFYRNVGSSGVVGEILVQTDAESLDRYMEELVDEITCYISEHGSESSFRSDIAWIISNSTALALKIAGTKVDKVLETILLTCGNSSLDECEPVYQHAQRPGGEKGDDR